MTKQYAPALQGIWEVHQIVDQSASWALNVAQTKHVFAKNVPTRVQEYVGTMPSVACPIIAQFVHVSLGIPVIHLGSVWKQVKTELVVSYMFEILINFLHLFYSCSGWTDYRKTTFMQSISMRTQFSVSDD